MGRGRAFALRGEAEAPGLVHPGEDTALGAPNSIVSAPTVRMEPDSSTWCVVGGC